MSFSFGVDPNPPGQLEKGKFSAFLAFSNFHIPLVALGLTTSSYILLAAPINTAYVVAACCGAFVIYQLDRWWLIGEEDAINQPARVAWIGEHAIFKALILGISLCIGGVAALSLSVSILLAGAGLATFGLLYLLPVLPGRRRLKSLWYAKPLAIALTWSLGSVYLAALSVNDVDVVHVALLLIYRFFFILPNVLLADWHDRAGDLQAGILSLALLISERQLRTIAALSAILSLLVGCWIGIRGDWPMVFFVDLVGPMLMLFICTRTLHNSWAMHSILLDLVVAWPLITVLAASAIL